MERILITGDCGLIGKGLAQRLRAIGHDVIGYDIARAVPRDILHAATLDKAAAACTGIVHLAAVSRVLHGQRNPGLCREVNVQGTRNVLSAAARAGRKPPWVLYASSREVYGQPTTLPVRESAPLRPVNAYARSKVSAERLVLAARSELAVKTAVVRFSGVYGSVSDHRDRVIPAFARLAASGGTLFVEGDQTLLDFTYVDDVVTALVRIVDLMSGGEAVPTMHLVSGQAITLLELATLATKVTGKGRVVVTEPRRFDVTAFVGDPTLAHRVLGWTAQTSLADGMRMLITLFQQEQQASSPLSGELPRAVG